LGTVVLLFSVLPRRCIEAVSGGADRGDEVEKAS